MAHSAQDLASSGYLDPLREALDSSFTSSDPSLLSTPAPEAPAQPPTQPGSQPSAPAPASAESSDAPADDTWKAEYDNRLAAWRAEAAVARQKAEEERARWARIRETEPLPDVVFDAPGHPVEPVLGEGASEPEGGHMFSSVHSDFPSIVSLGSTPPTIPSLFQTDTDSGVEVSAGTKSSPEADESSLAESAPRRRPAASSSAAAAAAAAAVAATASKTEEKSKEAPKPEAPITLVVSVFSPNLPLRTRLLALASTLAINLALPFLNGVMLGFGEIFAKNYIAVWIGWSRRSRGAPTAVGVRY